MENNLDSSKINRTKNKNKEMKKTIIASAFVLGIILTVFAYQAITIYQLRSQIANDHTTLTQVVDFLNQNIQQAQQNAVKGTSQQVQAPASTATKK